MKPSTPARPCSTGTVVVIIDSGADGVAVNINDSAPGHSCAVLTNGTVQCWGYNEHGELGDGTNKDSPVPVKTPVTGAVTVACGSRHSSALLKNGTVRCWGDNQYGATAGASTTKLVNFN